jgi:signal transduction histidine kinase
MRNTRTHTVWFFFVVAVFAILLATALIMFLLTVSAINSGLYTIPKRNPILGIFLLMLVSLIVGTILSIVIGRSIIRPITRLSQATGRVAGGDFKAFLPESDRVREIRDMEVNFNKMVRDLGGIETLRSDFIASVSHEFRTPLGSIEGYATLLQGEGLTKAETMEYTAAIIESTRKLSTLAGNILKISKLENQGIVLEKTRFRLDEQIRDVFLALEPKWSAKGLELDIDLDDLEIFGSEELLRQVWLNLIENAIKFTPEGGEIRARLTLEGAKAVVLIADTGVGMSEETRARMFEKFYQGEAARSQEGNGLGLTLVKRILDLIGGEMRVGSAPGEGTSMTVTLTREAG